jgi:hypothetical protein
VIMLGLFVACGHSAINSAVRQQIFGERQLRYASESLVSGCALSLFGVALLVGNF